MDIVKSFTQQFDLVKAILRMVEKKTTSLEHAIGVLEAALQHLHNINMARSNEPGDSQPMKADADPFTQA